MKPRFTIRALLLAVAVFAVCAVLVRTSGWVSALGFGASATILLLALRMPTERLGPQTSFGIRLAAWVIASVVAWLSVVDYSEWYEECPRCDDERHVCKLRIFGKAVSSECVAYKAALLSRLGSDLGAPCEHDFDCLCIVRKWGLVYRTESHHPAIDDVFNSLSVNNSSYNEEVSRRVRQFAKENPDEAVETCRSIVEDKDYPAVYDFIEETTGSNIRPHGIFY